MMVELGQLQWPLRQPRGDSARERSAHYYYRPGVAVVPRVRR